MRKELMLASLLAALGVAAPAIPFTPETRPSPRKALGWPKRRRDHALDREIAAHNEAIEQRRQDRLAARQAKRMAGSQA